MAASSGYNASQKYYYRERCDDGSMYMSDVEKNYVMKQYDGWWDYLKKKVYYTDGSGDWYWQYVYDSNGNHYMVSGAGAKLTGSKFNDSIYNNGASVIIYSGAKTSVFGEEGNDSIYNDGSNSKLDGGAGNDSIKNYGKATTINGGVGNDSVCNYVEKVTIDAGANNDYIYNYGDAKSSNILGGAGNDSIENCASQVTIDGGANNDYIYNGDYAKSSKILGGAGNDSVRNYGEKVTIDGGAGDDSIENYASQVTINGGAGVDTIYSNADSVKVAGGDGDDEIEVYGAKLTINGGKGNDYIKVEKMNNRYSDGVYNGDKYTGRLFEYALGDGDDTIECFSMKDRLVLDISKATYSEKYIGKDILVTFGKGTILLKGAAVDMYLTDYNKSNVTFGGGTKTADASTRSTAIKITGNALDNVIIGTKVADTLNGGAGDDTLTGGKGSDIFVCTGGRDVIRDYTTADKISIAGGLTYTNHYVNGKDLVLEYGNGNSLTIMNGANKAITTVNGKNSSVNVYTNEIKLNKDSTSVTLSSAADDFSASGYTKLATIDGSHAYAVKIVGNKLANKIIGSEGKDSLFGGAGNDTLFGGTKDDTLSGGDGNDSLSGGTGDDSLNGGNGNDTLGGGKGDDILAGGKGNDLFVYENGNDYITDYAAGDKISIKANFESVLTRTELNGSDGVLVIGKDELTVKNIRGKALDITDSTGKNFSVWIGGVKLTDSDKSKIIFTSDVEFANASARKKNIIIKGNSLANTIVGGSGNDSLWGGTGDDTLWGGAGNDVLYGGDGYDTFIYKPGEGTDKIFDYYSRDMLKILKTNGAAGGTFTKSSFIKGTLTLTISGGGFVVFNGVNQGDRINVNNTTYEISGNKLVK